MNVHAKTHQVLMKDGIQFGASVCVLTTKVVPQGTPHYTLSSVCVLWESVLWEWVFDIGSISS